MMRLNDSEIKANERIIDILPHTFLWLMAKKGGGQKVHIGQVRGNSLSIQMQSLCLGN